MLASSFVDPVLGIDLHWEMVPTPAPVPTPFPHPFIGIVWDPGSLVSGLVTGALVSAVVGGPFQGPVLYWGAFPATNTGTQAKHVPGHFLFPPGTMWAPFPKAPKPKIRPKDVPVPGLPIKPENDAVCIFGSQTVSVMGASAVRLGDIALSCSEPVRLPSSVVLAIPKGAPILVGGPPSLNIMEAVLASLRTRFVSDALHALVSRMKPGRFRNFLHRTVCFFTGHPVDVATGKVMTSAVDAELPGPLSLNIERVYSSAFASRRGPLGHGWSWSLDQAVWRERGKVVLLSEDGREIEFDTFDHPDHRIEAGQELWQPIDRLTLRCRAGGRWEIEGADGTVREFAPVPGRADGRAMIQRVRSRDGEHEIVFSYDAAGRLERVRDAGGRLLAVEHDERGRVTRLKLPLPAGHGWYTHRKYEYDAHDDLVKVTDSLGQVWRFEYMTHLLVREIDRAGLSFYFQYDGLGEDAWCVRTWGDGGIYDHKIGYDKKNRVTFVTNSLGQTTQYHMNLVGLVTKVVDPMGGATAFEHDAATLQTKKVVDPLGRTTEYSYDPRGRITRVLRPDGAAHSLAYDGKDDKPSRLTDPAGHPWTWSYDEQGRLLARRDPLGNVTRYRYAGGQVIGRIDPGGAETAFEYDRAGNLTAISSPEGGARRWFYDSLGRAIKKVDARGAVHRRVLDLEGRVVALHDPVGSASFVYDPEGRLLERRDPQRDVQFTYQGMGRVASRTEAGATVRFTYDTEESLVAITDELGHSYRFRFGPSGLLEEEIGFDGQRRRYTYDAAGQVVRVERPSGRTTRYSYDPAGRVTSVEHGDGSYGRFVYSAEGELAEVSNEAASVGFERDALGRVLEERQGEHWIASAYGPAGRRVRIRSSLGARQDIERNASGDVTAVRYGDDGGPDSFEVRFARDVAGDELERSFSTGVRSVWDRDLVGRGVRNQVFARQSLQHLAQYRWGAGGGLEEAVDYQRGATRFDRDRFGALRWAKHPGGDFELRIHDAVDNLFRTEDRADRSYGPAGQLLEARDERGVTRYIYDAEGSLIEKHEPDGRLWLYTWNDAGLLVGVTRSDGTAVTFTYDPFGRRLTKTHGAHTTRWVWDRNVPLHEWVEDARPAAAASPAAQPITWLFEPGTFAPMAKLEGGGRNAIVTDDRGTPVAMYDEHGAPVWRATLGVWGQLQEVEGPRQAVPFRWPGQYEDAETGLYYNRWRYYDPDAGAYVSQDPLGLRAGPRAYAYPHDPTQLCDALGLIHESTPGYNVYVIADKATGEPIYVGITDDIRRRTGEHEGVRYDPDKHVYVPVVRDVTYGEARGAEQALMEDLNTKVKSKRGTFPNNIVDSVAAHRLDDPDGVREETFSEAYKKHKSVTHTEAREKIDKACKG